MEILVLHPGALGDIILSLPALSLLRRRYPQSTLTLAGSLDFVRAVSRGIADKSRSLSELPLHRLYAEAPLPAEDLRFWKSYERIVSWTGAGEAVFGRRLALTGAKVIVAGWKPDGADERHVARIFVESLYPWIPPVESISGVRISVDPQWSREARAWLGERGWDVRRKLVALHPGAGSAGKRWSARNFRELARRLLQYSWTPLIIEGPAEPGLGSGLLRELGPGALLSESLPLPLLAGLLAGCRAFVGNDSGIAHFAAGLGVPSVVLFGSTAPRHWAPLGENVTVLQNTCLERISIERVWHALRKAEKAGTSHSFLRFGDGCD